MLFAGHPAPEYGTEVPARGGKVARIVRVGENAITTSAVAVRPPPLAVILYVPPGVAFGGMRTRVANLPSGWTSALATCVPSGQLTVIAAPGSQLVPRIGSVAPGAAVPPLSVGGGGVGVGSGVGVGVGATVGTGVGGTVGGGVGANVGAAVGATVGMAVGVDGVGEGVGVGDVAVG